MRPLLFVHVSKAANVQNASGGTMAGQKEGKAERTDQSNVKAVAEEIRRAVRQATLDAMEEEQARPKGLAKWRLYFRRLLPGCFPGV